MFNQIPAVIGGRIIRTYLGSVADSATNGNVGGTFSLGAEDPSRRILVAALGGVGTTPTSAAVPASLNCAGQSMVAGYLYSVSTIVGFAGVAMMMGAFHVPTGLTASISASFSWSGALGSATKMLMAWSIIGAGSNVPLQVVPENSSLGIPAGGAIIGASGYGFPSGTGSFSGIPTDGQNVILVGGSQVSDDEVAPFAINGSGTYGALTQWEPG